MSYVNFSMEPTSQVPYLRTLHYLYTHLESLMTGMFVITVTQLTKIFYCLNFVVVLYNRSSLHFSQFHEI